MNVCMYHHTCAVLTYWPSDALVMLDAHYMESQLGAAKSEQVPAGCYGLRSRQCCSCRSHKLQKLSGTETACSTQPYSRSQAESQEMWQEDKYAA